MRWKREPGSIARFRSQWLVADGSRTLFAFNDGGKLTAKVNLPVATLDVFVSRDMVWVYDSLHHVQPQRFWYSSDLKSFKAAALTMDDEQTTTSREKLLSKILHIAPSTDAGFYYAHAVGKPVITKANAAGRSTEFAVAYSRSRRRAALISAGDEKDPTNYSLPIRHMLVAKNGEIYVLRNREDVVVDRKVVAQQGRRVDRYTATGRHLGTALLPGSGRWLLRVNGDQVTAFTGEGTVVRATFGPAVPGRVVEASGG